MIAYRLPVYVYFSGVQNNIPMEYVILCSDKLFYSINSSSIQYDSGNVPQGETREYTAEEVSTILQNVFGDNVIMKNMPVYINTHDVSEASIVESTKKMFNFIGARALYYDLAVSGPAQPTRIFNYVDGNDIKVSVQVETSATPSTSYSSYASASDGITPFCNISPFTGNVQIEAGGQGFVRSYSSTSAFKELSWSFMVFPENIFEDGTLNLAPTLAAGYKPVIITITLIGNIGSDSVRRIYAAGRTTNNDAVFDAMEAHFADITKIVGPGTPVTDTDNPYGIAGSSSTGGGNGHGGDIDGVEKTEIPDLPSITAADLGFITMYNPSKSQLIALSSFMWSGLFDLDTYKKLFSDPMESIIGLSIVPVAPSLAGSKNVMFGSIDSGVTMPYLSTQYVQFNCGSVTIEDYIGSFLDYSPYTKISVYLPYIGIHEISPEDIMNDSINITYNIDVLSGACGAFISSSKKGVLYSYNGSCISNIPLTSINFSSAIQNAVSAVCSGAATIAGIATGVAPLTASGVGGLLNSAANTAMNSKPTVQRSGSLGGSAGVLSVQKPYLIIERPNLSVPSNVQKFVGQTSNISAYLGNLSGFTIVEYVHIENIPATDEEIKEIEQLLKEGVYL